MYAISDLHLSFAVDKPRDIFGDGWQDHFEKVKADWLGEGSPPKTPCCSAAISPWGISVAEAAPDYAALAELPGRKIVLRGNHDYYWSTLSKMRAAFPDFDFVQNNCVRAGNVLVAGLARLDAPVLLEPPPKTPRSTRANSRGSASPSPT